MRGADLRPGGDAADFAQYVATLAADLARLAREHRLGTLAYLLDMARLEARSHVEDTGHRPETLQPDPPRPPVNGAGTLRFVRPGRPLDPD